MLFLRKQLLHVALQALLVVMEVILCCSMCVTIISFINIKNIISNAVCRTEKNIVAMLENCLICFCFEFHLQKVMH